MSEAQIILSLQRVFLASVWGIWAVIFLARAWILVFAPVLSWVWAYGKPKEKHAVKEALWSLGLALLAGEVMALLILRVRPYLEVSNIISLIPPPLTSSFPSIHTAASTAMAAALYAGNKRLGQLGILIVIGVALGRMAAGVHYPSDILGGVLVGLASFAMVRFGHKALRKKSAK